ncbi:MAG: DUF262 domain-containing protein [Desulfobacterales bacterium]|nr:DUF262 domain-containing protein [Desulfobacterales bacterium]
MAIKDSPVVKPEVVFIEELLEEIAQGKLRVPRFQRPFVWKPSDMRNLYDSIYKGYPIGSLLLWESIEDIESLDHVGAIQCPKPSSPPVSYILDGHQRLATLFGGLRLKKDAPRGDGQKNWQWWIWFDLKEKFFTHVPKGIPKSWLLPMRAILKTVDFLEFARKIQNECPDDSSVFIEEAENLAQKVKNYKVAVIRIKGGSLDQAVAIFSRLNTMGQSITPDQMVSALTYREGKNQIHLARRIDEILYSLSDYNFGNINRFTVFRSIVAAAGRDIHKSDWEDLAGKLGKDLPHAADIAEKSLMSAVRFLYEELRVSSDKLLPYTHQILLLSEFFHYCSEPDARQKEILKRWFWITSLSGWFAGINTTKLNHALKEMCRFAKDGSVNMEIMSPDEPARPFPESFDMRSARIRALLIFMLCLNPLNPDTGEAVETDRLFSTYGKHTLPYVFPRITKDIISNPANRILLERKPRKTVKDQLCSIDLQIQSQVLKSHGISDDAYELLIQNDAHGFVKTRAENIAELEREFMLKNRITPPKEGTGFGETDIDTDDD